MTERDDRQLYALLGLEQVKMAQENILSRITARSPPC